MSMFNPRNPAEASDSLAKLTAAATGLAALVYSVNVIENFVSEGMAAVLGYGQVASGLLLLAVLVPLMLLFKSRGGQPAGRPSSGGYLSALFRQAALTAFSLTLVFLIALSILDDTVLARITAKTAIDLAITFALAAFAASFFLTDRLSALDDARVEEN